MLEPGNVKCKKKKNAERRNRRSRARDWVDTRHMTHLIDMF
jgi:hypothetical protein